MKVGLYGITYLGIWYKGPGLTCSKLITKARELGYEGVEFDGKRPQANPMDLDERARGEIRGLAAKEGIEIAAISANNNFTSPVTEDRECQLLMVRELIRLCKDLGAPVLWLFAAWPGVTMRNGVATYDMTLGRPNDFELRYPSATWLEKWHFARECFKEAAKYAEDDGVILALQNHPPLIQDYKDALAFVREVDSPNFRMCLDVPCEVRQDDEWVRQAVLDTGDLQAHSHFSGELERGDDGQVRLLPSRYRETVNYLVFLKTLCEIGYEGYLCYEFCHPALTEDHEPAGIDYIDKHAQLALEYMRNALAEAEAAFSAAEEQGVRG